MNSSDLTPPGYIVESPERRSGLEGSRGKFCVRSNTGSRRQEPSAAFQVSIQIGIAESAHQSRTSRLSNQSSCRLGDKPPSSLSPMFNLVSSIHLVSDGMRLGEVGLILGLYRTPTQTLEGFYAATSENDSQPGPTIDVPFTRVVRCVP